MINVDKHVAYWLNTAEDSWSDAEYLLKGKRYSFAAFAAHLALEKVLKAHVARKIEGVPPKVHDLAFLARLAELSLSDEYAIFLKYFDEYQLEGRYPEKNRIAPKGSVVTADISKAKELFQWLKQQL